MYACMEREEERTRVTVYRAVIETIYSTDNVGAHLLGVLNGSFQIHS